MLANARVLGHTFDPLSVFWAIAPDGSLRCIVAEVHNTYGERHAYLLETDDAGKATVDKAFYVSPFFTVDGRYDLQFTLTPESVSSTVILRQGGEAVFTATFRGTPRPATAGPSRQTSRQNAPDDPSHQPADPNTRCMALDPQIAGRHTTGSHTAGRHAMTEIATARWPGIAHTPRTPAKARVAKAILKPTINRVPVRLTMADGTRWGAGDDSSPEMRVVRPKAFFARLGADTKIGFGEAYMAGDWTTGDGTDLADLLTPFAERLTTIVPGAAAEVPRLRRQEAPAPPAQLGQGLAKNIEAHYDLSNELFAQFLDPSMNYSSAWFEGDETLEEAQMRKIDAVLDDAHVGEGTRVLEIGSGWGSLAIRAAQRGAKVTTITISKEQAALAEERFAEAGVDVDLQLVDYREVTGEYDAIVSVEMIEAVGEEFWPTYFSDDRQAARTRRSRRDPGDHDGSPPLPRDAQLVRVDPEVHLPGRTPPLARPRSTRCSPSHTTLAVTNQRPLGSHYARTLRQWRDNFNANWDDDQRPGLRRDVPPHVGVLSRLLRGRLRHGLHQRAPDHHVAPDRLGALSHGEHLSPARCRSRRPGSGSTKAPAARPIPETFFSPDAERGPRRRRREAAAKALCAVCPVRQACLEHALAVREPYGVWGGLNINEREMIIADRKAG